MAFWKKKEKKLVTQKQKGYTPIQDILAPSFVEVDFTHIKVDDTYYRTLFAVGYPRYVGPNWLHSLITFDHPIAISMCIYPADSGQTLKDLRRKIAEMEATVGNDVQSGRVADPTVQVALEDALSLQGQLAQGSERFFQFGLYITLSATTKEELESVTHEVESALSSLLIVGKVATLESEEGFKATVPFFQDRLGILKNMDTTSLAMSFPFSSASLTAHEGVLYGVNQYDNSLVIFDRFTLESANSVILGKSGGGKSFLVKLESMRQLYLGTDVIIIDPENEYAKIAEKVDGEFVSFSLGSEFRINPFELNTQSPEDDELSNKILNLHSLIRVIVGNLTPGEDALLDKALVQTYKNNGITHELSSFKNEPPLLEDLYKVLVGFETDEAQDIALRLEKFIKGSAAGIFNEKSNFSIKNSFTVFGIRDLEENVRPVAMYILLDYVWNIIRRDRKKRVLVVDEAWYLIKNKDSAEYLYNFAKRARKYQLGLTTITQDVDDFLATDEGRAILNNSSLQILLKQSTAAIDVLSTVFHLSTGEKQFLLSTGVGEGLFFAGTSHVPIRIMASPEELALLQTA